MIAALILISVALLITLYSLVFMLWMALDQDTKDGNALRDW